MSFKSWLGLWKMLMIPYWGWSWYGHGHWSSIQPWYKFCFQSWFWRCKEHACPLSLDLRLCRMLDVHDWGLQSYSWFWYGRFSLIFTCSEFWLSILILKVQRTSMSFRSWLGLWRTLYVPDWGFGSWSWFGYGHWSLVHPWYIFWIPILILKVQRTSMSFKSWYGSLKDAGGYWLGFGILIMIWIYYRILFGSSLEFSFHSG